MTPLEADPPALIEWLIHLLELSVVIGIAIVVWVNRKYSPGLNKKLQERLDREDST
jgi:hypothetical protein